MKIDDYPAQEPLSPLGRAYQERVLAAGHGVLGEEFAYGDSPWQRLTLHHAAQPAGPVLLFLHGGGWTSGYKEWMDFMAPALNALGVVFVTAGYRLAPEHSFPDGFDDAASAMAWVHRHVGAHAGDADRLFVGGHSAGGHYAALLAVTSAWRRAHRLPADVVRGCLPVSGVYRFDADSGLSMRPRFLGPAEPHDAATEASPLLVLERAATPPFLLSWGTRDFPHLVTQGRQMAEALVAAGVPADIHVLEGCDHFEASLACGDARSGWPARAAAWMQAIAAKKPQPHAPRRSP
jgi:acetyl esterase/lipase